MNREQEALATISMIGNVPDEFSVSDKGNEILFRASVVALLSDISLSLAVIADKMERGREETE